MEITRKRLEITRKRRHSRKRTILWTTCALGAALTVCGASRLPATARLLQIAPVGVQVVMSGLDNPRGLTFDKNGALYVAEAGRGGNGQCEQREAGIVCAGLSGAVSRLYNGRQERVAEGLPSLATLDGSQATGPHDVSVLGSGNPQVVVGLGGTPGSRSSDTVNNPKQYLGYLATIKGTRKYAYTDDVSTFETTDPDGTGIDTNPNSVLLVPGARIVADAGGNDLLKVTTGGQISTLAVFPQRLVDAPPFLGLPPGTQIPMESVPTCVVQGPDGAYYIGELTGFPFPVGGARVYRVVPGQTPTVYRSGFTNISDIAFGADGSLYVLELAKNGLLSNDLSGRLVRVTPNGTQSTVVSDGLFAPLGLAAGPDGALYVSNKGILAGAGEVLKITL